MPDQAGNRIADGSLDFSQGVDSSKVTTLESGINSRGLSRNQLAWLFNGTVRGGGISPRNGWFKVTTIVANPATYGGGWMYDPPGDDFPWLVVVIGGNVYEIRLDLDNSVHLFPPTFPATIPDKTGYHFAQAEEFLVMQPGDGVTNPLFYYPHQPSGVFWLRQSNGVISPHNPLNEIPAATAMDYYEGRLWYARGRSYSGGDIVGSQASGLLVYNFRNSVLAVTENPLAAGGDGFIVPAADGHIRALAHTANINKALGEGEFYVFTRKQVYSLKVPISRNDWINTTSNEQPLQTIVQRRYGSVGDRCIVPVNSDLFYYTMEPGARSLALAVRNANQWSNTSISANETRLIALDDRQLLRDTSGVQFDNRLLYTTSPVSLPGVGTAFRGLAPLDFDRVSSLDDLLSGEVTPTWEGAYGGNHILQLFTGDFGGRERAFAVVFSTTEGTIDLWEMTDFARRENGDNRIDWFFETPAYTWETPFSMKELDGAEIWIDELAGECVFKAYYRVDGYNCWIPWVTWTDCAARNSAEEAGDDPYPTEIFCDQHRAPFVLPKPPSICIPGVNRPSNLGYQFQFKLEVKGWCRIRGLILYALPRMRPPFGDKFVCST